MNPADDLNPLLMEMDQLRAGQQTKWASIEKHADNLLARFPSPADRGRIHWQAAHVYGQSDIGGHARDVIRHAREALKYERDPVQRGWLFMYLGNASEVIESTPQNFVERRAEATRWYLRGYRELLPYNLPEKAPELPVIEKGGHAEGTESEAERLADEVRRDAQAKVRKDAELIRELVHRRGVYVDRLNDMYGRMHNVYDKDSDAKNCFTEIATEVARGTIDRTWIEKLSSQLWPATPANPGEEERVPF
jgi:hypothetical protein